MSDVEEVADSIDDGIGLDGAPARCSSSIGPSPRKGTRSASWGPQNVPLPAFDGVQRKVITAATAAALIIDIIYRIPVPAQFGSRPDAPADCLVFHMHDPDPSAKVKDWRTGFGTTSKTVALHHSGFESLCVTTTLKKQRQFDLYILQRNNTKTSNDWSGKI